MAGALAVNRATLLARLELEAESNLNRTWTQALLGEARQEILMLRRRLADCRCETPR